MPGFAHPDLVVPTFVAVKTVGYACFAILINRRYQIKRNVLAVGLVRAALGFGSFLLLTSISGAPMTYGDYFGVLLIGRFVDWLILIMIFYDRRLGRPGDAVFVVVAGTVVSFVLDLPALIGSASLGGLSC